MLYLAISDLYLKSRIRTKLPTYRGGRSLHNCFVLVIGMGSGVRLSGGKCDAPTGESVTLSKSLNLLEPQFHLQLKKKHSNGTCFIKLLCGLNKAVHLKLLLMPST